MNQTVSKKNKLTHSMAKDPYITRLVIILIVVFVMFSIIKPTAFLKPLTFQSMVVQFPEFGLMSLGVMVCMITGGIDLSAVGTANMASLASALVLMRMVPADATPQMVAVGILCTVLVGLIIGAAAGILNGFLISKIKIPPILATLGTFELFTGIAIILTKGKPISGLPSAYSEIFAGSVGGVVPMPLIIFIIATIVVAFLLNKTSFGKKIYMLGTNEKAAVFSGLKTNQLLIKTYMLSGILCAMGGLIMMANYNSAKADYGSAYTLQTVLIVVLGGVNPNGGSGKVSGVVLSIIVLQMLSSGLNMFPGISNFYRPLIWGSVLLVIMIADNIMSQRPRKKVKA